MTLSRRTFLSLTGASAAVVVVALPSEVLASSGPPELTPERMAHLFTKVEMWDDKVERIWVHPRTAVTFPAVFGLDAYDQQYQGILLDLGLAGSLWGADVRTNERIAEGDVFLVGTSAWDDQANSWLAETACRALCPWGPTR